MSTSDVEPSADELFARARAVEAAVQRAVAEALREHKLLGHTVVGWRDGKVVRIPPEEIVVDEKLLGSDDAPAQNDRGTKTIGGDDVAPG